MLNIFHAWVGGLMQAAFGANLKDEVPLAHPKKSGRPVIPPAPAAITNVEAARPQVLFDDFVKGITNAGYNIAELEVLWDTYRLSAAADRHTAISRLPYTTPTTELLFRHHENNVYYQYGYDVWIIPEVRALRSSIRTVPGLLAVAHCYHEAYAADNPELPAGAVTDQLLVMRRLDPETHRIRLLQLLWLTLMSDHKVLAADDALLISVNDTFYHACSDSEDFELVDVPELCELYDKYGEDGLIAWVAWRRRAKPIAYSSKVVFDLAFEDVTTRPRGSKAGGK